MTTQQVYIDLESSYSYTCIVLIALTIIIVLPVHKQSYKLMLKCTAK